MASAAASRRLVAPSYRELGHLETQASRTDTSMNVVVDVVEKMNTSSSTSFRCSSSAFRSVIPNAAAVLTFLVIALSLVLATPFPSLERRSSTRLIAKTMDDNDSSKCRILALHGSGGSGPQFAQTLEPLRVALQSRQGIDVELTCLTAPFPSTFNGNEGFSWWDLPPGKRYHVA